MLVLATFAIGKNELFIDINENHLILSTTHLRPHLAMRLRILLALDYYDYRIHKGIAQFAAKENWSLVSTQSIPGSSPVPKHWRGDGIISLVNYAQTYDAIAEHQVPTIDLALTPLPTEIPRVVTNNYAIGQLAATHFLEKGLKSFVVLDTISGKKMFEQRLAGFTDTLDTSDVTIIKAVNQTLGQSLEQAELPCGIFGYHDGLAIAAMEEVLSLGYKIPRDVAILGVDNNDLICESTDITLSSIESDQIGLGELAAGYLKKLLDGKTLVATARMDTNTQVYRYHAPQGVISRESTDNFYTKNAKVNGALKYIENNLSKGVTANQTASFLGMTQQGLQSLFRQHYRCPPATAIRQMRLKQAQLYLRNTNDNIKTIYSKCGYQSVDSMCRSFRRDLGITPAQWRKNKHPDSISGLKLTDVK